MCVAYISLLKNDSTDFNENLKRLFLEKSLGSSLNHAKKYTQVLNTYHKLEGSYQGRIISQREVLRRRFAFLTEASTLKLIYTYIELYFILNHFFFFW